MLRTEVQEGRKVMKKKVSFVLSIVLTAASVLTGCSRTEALDGTQVVAVLDETTNMQLGELNLMLRYEEAQMQTYYASMFGTYIYQQDMGEGKVYGDVAAETQMEDYKRMYILEAEAANVGVELTEDEKAAITETAKQFLKDNTDKAKAVMGVTQEHVERALTLQTIEKKIYDVWTADVNTEVSDEEAAQKKISYVLASTQGSEYDEEGNVIPLEDAEKESIRKTAEAVLAEAKKSDDLSAAAEANGLTATEVTYGADSVSPAEEVRAAGDELKEGEYSELIETDSGYYIVYLVSELDREATDAKKETIVENRKTAMFEEEYQKVAEAHSFVIKEEVLAQLTFDRPYTLKVEAE